VPATRTAQEFGPDFSCSSPSLCTSGSDSVTPSCASVNVVLQRLTTVEAVEAVEAVQASTSELIGR